MQTSSLSYPASRRVSSFSETLREVNDRMLTDTLSDRSLGREIALIINEVLRLDADRVPFIRIGGEDKPTDEVQSVYCLFEREHAELVIEQVKKIQTPIKFKKAYIRTMVYNSVFEIETHYQLMVNADFGG